MAEECSSGMEMAGECSSGMEMAEECSSGMEMAELAHRFTAQPCVTCDGGIYKDLALRQISFN